MPSKEVTAEDVLAAARGRWSKHPDLALRYWPCAAFDDWCDWSVVSIQGYGMDTVMAQAPDLPALLAKIQEKQT